VDPQGLQAREGIVLKRQAALALLAPLLAGAPLPAARASADEALPPVVVYAPSPCLACIDWAEHLRKHGFQVTIEEKPQAEMPRVKRWLNVPSRLESVHTARVGGYFVEGHVPAPDILLLLKEKPRARGLAVPGLPRGAPGRESWSPLCDTACTVLDNDAAKANNEIRREAFETLLVAPDGRTSIYARH
jgi:hypothetical protein